MSEQDVIGRAKEAIPEHYHGQTWILNKAVLEKALEVPRDSHNAAIAILDSKGEIVAQVHGPPTDERLNTLVAAAKGLK